MFWLFIFQVLHKTGLQGSINMKITIKPIYAILILISLLHNTSYAQQSRTEGLTKNLVSAMNSLDSKTIIALIDDSCKISTFPRGINDRLIPLIFNQKFSAIAEYQILREMKEGQSTRVYLGVKYANGREGEPNFLFSEKGKALELNIVKSVPVASKTKNDVQELKGFIPDSLQIPFDLVDNLVYLTVAINGKKGQIQFDSGSAFTILQGNILSQGNLKKLTGGQAVTGINGASQLSEVVLDSLTIGKLKLTDFKVNAMGGQAGGNSWGLLGYDFLNAFEVTIDYNRKLMTLIKVDSVGNYSNPAIETASPILSFPIVMQRHIPILELSVGGKEYPMGLDYGANSNLLFSEHYAELKPILTHETEVNMFGLGDRTVKVKSAEIAGARVAKLRFSEMQTVFTDNNMANANSSERLRISGILGYPFLCQYVVALNFKKGVARFY